MIDFLIFFLLKKIFTNFIKNFILTLRKQFNFVKNGKNAFMISNKQDAIQLLNTAFIKSKEKRINASYEERLSKICNSPVMNALLVAIDHLSEDQKVSKDHASVQLIETIRELDSIWNDYVLMEGIGKLKDLLRSNVH